MATGGVGTPDSPERLSCPLCLGVFEHATLLSCGHTYCRKCLTEHDASRQARDHIECPLCRSHTKLKENRVEGLPANVIVNGLVDDYRGKTGLFASREVTAKCTICTVKGEAVSFCRDCDHYMCDDCHNAHQQLSGLFADHRVLSTSDRVIPKTAQKSVFNSTDISHNSLGEIMMRQLAVQGTANRPFMGVKKIVKVAQSISGITAVSDDAVVICYGHFGSSSAANRVDSEGNMSHYPVPTDGFNYDLAHHSLTGNIAVLRQAMHGDWGISISSQADTCSRVNMLPAFYGSPSAISANHKDEIIIPYGNDIITIFDPSGRNKLCSITTMSNTRQVFETRSGAIISSTCSSETMINKVTAYDRSGMVGDTLTSDTGEFMYAAIDCQDRVYVARVNCTAGTVDMTKYMMDGLKFTKVVQFEKLTLCGEKRCYMVYLSCDMLAFASGRKLYFIKVPPS